MNYRKSPLTPAIVLYLVLIILIIIPSILHKHDQAILKPMDVNKARILVSSIAVDIGNQYHDGSPIPGDFASSLEKWSKDNETALTILSLAGQTVFQTRNAPPLPEELNLMEFAQPDASFYRLNPGLTRLMVPVMKNGVQVGNSLFFIPLKKVSAEDGWISQTTAQYWLWIPILWALGTLVITGFLINRHYEKPYMWLKSAIHAAERNTKLPIPMKENHATSVQDGLLRLIDQWQDTFAASWPVLSIAVRSSWLFYPMKLERL